MGDFAQIVKIMRGNGWSDTRILNAFLEVSDISNNSNVLTMAKLPLEERIKTVLEEVCMSPKGQGYNLWVEAIQMYIESNKKLEIGEIYRNLAQKRGKSYSAIAGSMNKSAKDAFAKCPKEIGQRIWGKSVYYVKEEGLSQKEFLTRIANNF